MRKNSPDEVPGHPHPQNGKRIVETFVERLEKMVDRLVEEPRPETAMLPWMREDMSRVELPVPHPGSVFDSEDRKLLNSLADLAVRNRLQEKLARRQVWEAGSAAKADELAHEINNPLQSLTNILYLAQQGGEDAQTYLHEAYTQLADLSELVRKLLGEARRPVPQSTRKKPASVKRIA
jgi:signal transduction histidine kinase